MPFKHGIKGIGFLSVFLLAFSFMDAQTYIGIKTGGGGGWWLQQSNAANVSGSAWDRSHFNIHLGTEVSIEKQLGKKVRFGAFGFYSAVQDTEMVGSTDMTFSRVRIPIAEKWFSMLGGGVQMRYTLLQSGRFSLSGCGQLGFFHLNTSHEDKNGFEDKFTFSLGPNFSIQKGKFTWNLQSVYSEYRFNNTLQEKGKHKMYFLNFNLGLQYKLSERE